MKLVAAFAAVYLIWGSTYLGIRFAIETLPPFSMASVRFLVAGLVLYLWARASGADRPSGRHWLTAAVAGGLLLAGGNGGVVWAEQRVPSGLAALLVATVPLWMAVLEWARPGGTRPRAGVAVGVALGLGGVALLAGPGELAGGARPDPLGTAVLLLASLSWAAGSVYLRRAPLPRSQALATGMEMVAGGALLGLAALAAGEPGGLDLGGASLRSWLALAYLVIFGSLVGFTAYTWLLKATTAARASTYAFVNPVVAVFLGWALAGEPVTARTLLAAAAILGAVGLITWQGAARQPGVGPSPGGPEGPPPPGPGGSGDPAVPAPAGQPVRLREIPPVRAPFVEERDSITRALRLLEEDRAAVLLTTYRGRPAVLTRADLERLLPSPATTLARYEVPDLVERVQVREAVRGPAPVLSADEEVRRAVAVMREWEWRPLVVMDGPNLYGVLTAEAILAATVERWGYRSSAPRSA
ncbi:MAG TPA: EamA family transporter [Dehalococcoidia bacterium]